MAPTIPKEKPKGLWDDEDAEEEDVKESWEDEEDVSAKVIIICFYFLPQICASMNYLFSGSNIILDFLGHTKIVCKIFATS